MTEVAYSPLPAAEEDQSYDEENPFAVNVPSFVSATNASKGFGTGAAAEARPSGFGASFCMQCSGVQDGDDAPLRRRKYCLTITEASVAVTFCFWFEQIVHNKFCDFLFKCNCTWTWAGGWDDCNVWNQVGAPRCPWCTARANVSWTTDYLLFALMVIAYFTALRLRKRIDITARFALPVVVYFLVGTLVGYLFKATGTYPTFIW